MSKAPEQVGPYRIIGRIGRGGMAVVYLARQPVLSRSVALKELAPVLAGDPALAQRFIREARVAGSLNHPNVVTVFDFLEQDGVPYIAMEYLERGSLRPFVGRMSLAQVGGALEGVLAALSHAEAMQIVHRDVKPENLLVTSDGGIKIADFGIAKALQQVATDEMLTPAGATVGTPAYMAPEQAMARGLGPWTDLYQTGVVAYELLTGVVPFRADGTPLAVLMKHIGDPVPPLPAGTDPALAAWVTRLLAKEPGDRPGSAREAWNELEEIVIRVVGPLWRREARLGEHEPTVEHQAPLTPARFSSWQDYVPESAATPPPPPPPVSEPTPPPPSPVPDPPTSEYVSGYIEYVPDPRAGEGAAPPERDEVASTAGEDAPPDLTAAEDVDAPPEEPSRDETPDPVPATGFFDQTPDPTVAPTPAAGEPPEAREASAPPPLMPVPGERPAPTSQPPAPPRRRPRALPLVLGLLALVVAAVALFALLGEDDDPGPTPTPTPTPTATATPPAGPFEAGDGPDGVAVGSGAVWSVASRDGTLTRIDPRSGDTTTVDVGRNPDGVVVAFGSVWVSLTGEDKVVRLTDAAQPQVQDEFDVGDAPEGMAASSRAIWVANSGDGSVTQIVEATREVRSVPDVADQPVDLAIGAGAVWVADAAGARVARVDGGRGELVATVGVGANPRAVAIVGRDVWVATAGDARAWRINGDTNEATGNFGIGGMPRDIATDGRSLFVVDREGDRVVALDARTGDSVDRQPVRGGPLSVAPDENDLWVTLFDAGRVARVPKP